MENLQVIKKIDEPTERVNSLVIVQKKSGALRICLHPSDVNKTIKREHVKLPAREEIMAQFAGVKWFSKPDTSSGFWQLRLDEEGSRLCTFNTIWYSVDARSQTKQTKLHDFRAHSRSRDNDG